LAGAFFFKPLFQDAAAKHAVSPGQLTLHADRGPSMKAKATALLLADLGVTKSHSRPYASNDNPFCVRQRFGRPSRLVHSRKSWAIYARHLCTKKAVLDQGAGFCAEFLNFAHYEQAGGL